MLHDLVRLLKQLALKRFEFPNALYRRLESDKWAVLATLHACHKITFVAVIRQMAVLCACFGPRVIPLCRGLKVESSLFRARDAYTLSVDVRL